MTVVHIQSHRIGKPGVVGGKTDQLRTRQGTLSRQLLIDRIKADQRADTSLLDLKDLGALAPQHVVTAHHKLS